MGILIGIFILVYDLLYNAIHFNWFKSWKELIGVCVGIYSIF